MRSRRGFTFIEIVVVIMILVILLAVAIPKMGSVFKRAELHSSARDLTGMLRYARHVAVLRGDGCQVSIMPRDGKYKLSLVHLKPSGDPDDDFKIEKPKKEEFKISDDVSKVHALSNSVFFSLINSTAPLTPSGDFPRLIFYPDGSATPGTITVQGADSKAFAIQVYRTTGLAVVHEGKAVLPPGTEPLYSLPENQPFDPTYKDRSLLDRLRGN